MGWTTSTDLAEFRTVAGGFLNAQPVHNTLLLSVAENMHTRGTAGRFGWWTAGVGGEVDGVFLHSVGRAPIISAALPEPAVDSLVDVLLPAAGGLEHINITALDAPRFIKQWTVRTGTTLVEGRIDRLYHLPRLIPPQPMPAGEGRIATEADRALLLAWMREFVAELEMGNPVESMVDYRLSFDGWWLWEVDGEPVAVAGHTPQLAGMVRIGPVYTPVTARRHGYAAAVTARVSAAASAAGAEHVLLFADVANPTSNGVYLRLGFRPVADRLELSFPD